MVHAVNGLIGHWTESYDISDEKGATIKTLDGTLDVTFAGRYAAFNDLMIDKSGSGYSLTFAISYSSQGTVVPPTTLSFPEVHRRPLTFKFTSLPSLQKQSELFEVIADLWDVVMDVKANPGVLVPPVTGLKCHIRLLTNNAVLS